MEQFKQTSVSRSHTLVRSSDNAIADPVPPSAHGPRASLCVSMQRTAEGDPESQGDSESQAQASEVSLKMRRPTQTATTR